jgi:hypothetical protein
VRALSVACRVLTGDGRYGRKLNVAGCASTLVTREPRPLEVEAEQTRPVPGDPSLRQAREELARRRDALEAKFDRLWPRDLADDLTRPDLSSAVGAGDHVGVSDNLLEHRVCPGSAVWVATSDEAAVLDLV